MQNTIPPRFRNLSALVSLVTKSKALPDTDSSDVNSDAHELELIEAKPTTQQKQSHQDLTHDTTHPITNTTNPLTEPVTEPIQTTEQQNSHPPTTTHPNQEPNNEQTNHPNTRNSTKRKETKSKGNPSTPATTTTTNNTTGKRTRHSNADRCRIAKAFRTECAHSAETPGAPAPTKRAFLAAYNAANHPNNPFGSHAFDNAIATTWPNEFVTLDPNGKTNHNKTTIFKLTAKSIRASIAKRGDMDIRYTEQDITDLAVRINDHLALYPNLYPNYQPTPIKHCFGTYFAKQYPTLLRYDTPTMDRATTITTNIDAHQSQHPHLCQSLIVSLYENKGYGLTTSKQIKKGTLIDIYRGDHYTEVIDPHLIDTSYVYESNGTHIDGSHPYSCFARYINESFGTVTDNATLDVTTNPPQICIFAKRTIEAWEEITMAYGPHYWQPYYRTFTLPPTLYNNVVSTYGTHYRTNIINTPNTYRPPTLKHQDPKIHHLYNPNGKVTHPKRYHSLDPSDTENTSDTSSDDDSTSSYEE